ncbi:MAG: aminotransferase class III-fold pyridoxal phosphate-dependent enzyme, partial [Planctomycetes bacterium]|nr:aminotransferase class III-fold pyridoxal phosphate-dependent enzyme [Planctomycetota bacterium]
LSEAIATYEKLERDISQEITTSMVPSQRQKLQGRRENTMHRLGDCYLFSSRSQARTSTDIYKQSYRLTSELPLSQQQSVRPKLLCKRAMALVLRGGMTAEATADLETLNNMKRQESRLKAVSMFQQIAEAFLQLKAENTEPGRQKLRDAISKIVGDTGKSKFSRDEFDLLLIFDEVQAGCGRTGKWFAYENYGVEPDIMTLAKSLCGGIAGAAMLARREIAPSLRPGMHAATFGGNPIAASAGIATIETIEREGLLKRAVELGEAFRNRFDPLVEELPFVSEVRVLGVMIGIELSVDATPLVEQCLERGLLVNCTQGRVVRLLPALTLTDDQLQEGCDTLVNVLRQYAPI